MFKDWYDIRYRPVDFHRHIQPWGRVITAQRDWEIQELIKIYKKLQPQHVLEIGSFYGGTLIRWMENSPCGAVICSIDNLQDIPAGERVKLLDHWEEAKPDGITLHILTGNSNDGAIYQLANDYLDGQIDFLFIDGDHSYKMVKSDFEMYGPLVRKGGIIAFHDITKLTSGDDERTVAGASVLQLWRQVQEAGYITQELRINLNTCGIGVVYA